MPTPAWRTCGLRCILNTSYLHFPEGPWAVHKHGLHLSRRESEQYQGPLIIVNSHV